MAKLAKTLRLKNRAARIEVVLESRSAVLRAPMEAPPAIPAARPPESPSFCPGCHRMTTINRKQMIVISEMIIPYNIKYFRQIIAKSLKISLFILFTKQLVIVCADNHDSISIHHARNVHP